MNLIGQILSFVTIIPVVLGRLAPTREGLLKSQIIANILGFLSYLCLGAYTAMALAIVLTMRCVVFYYKPTKTWAKSIAWLYLFIGLQFIAAVLAWEGWISLLPTMACTVFTCALWMENPKAIRVLSIVSTILWLPYDLVHMVIARIGLRILEFLAICVGPLGNSSNKSEVTEV